MYKAKLVFFFCFLNSILYTQNLNFEWVKNIKQITDDSYVNINDIKSDNVGNVYLFGDFKGNFDFDSTTVIHDAGGLNRNAFFAKYDSLGSLIWVKTYIDGGMYGARMTIDSQNNIIMVGKISGPTDFDFSSNSMVLTPSTINASYVAKYDENGSFIWAHKYDSYNSYPRDVVIDYNNDIIVYGLFSSETDFNFDSTEVFNLSSLSNNSKDLFINKFDSDGNFKWVKQFGGANGCEAFDIDVDRDNNLIMTGDYEGNVDFDPSPNFYNPGFISFPLRFICKLDSMGNLVWVEDLFFDIKKNGLGIDELNDIYICGTFSQVRILV